MLTSGCRSISLPPIYTYRWYLFSYYFLGFFPDWRTLGNMTFLWFSFLSNRCN
jgi:hypothetical protein